MRLRGQLFDGPDSLYRTQQELVKRAGHAVWLTKFTPARLEHLGYVNRLLQTFYELDICCALLNAYPAYIAGALSVYSTGGNVLSLLYIARTDSPILDNIYNKVPSFQLGPFTFALTVLEQFANYRDYSLFAITQGTEMVQFLLGVVDSVTCGAKSSINLLEFFLDTTVLFAFQMYGIVCVPLASPKVSYLRHHMDSSGAGRILPYAYRVSRTIDLEPSLSYPCVRVQARACVMYVSDNPVSAQSSVPHCIPYYLQFIGFHALLRVSA